MNRLLFACLLILAGAAHAQLVVNADDTLAGWQNPPCLGPGCAGGTGTPSAWNQTISNASPSLDGASMFLSVTGPVLSGGQTTNVLWPYKVGANNALVSFSGTYSVYLPSTTNVAAFEIDIFQFRLGQRFMFGTECDIGGNWRIWNQIGGAWVSTGVACTLTAATWHTINLAVHRVPGDTSCSGNPCMYYDTLTDNGTLYTLNLALPSGPSGDPNNVGIQFQIDVSSAGGTATAYLDKVNVSASLPSIAYLARTDTVAQPYPGTIPCPSASGCAGGGALNGANYQLTPSDFPSTPFVRITDNTMGGNHQGYTTSCSASSEVNLFGKNDDFFWACGRGGTQTLFKLDPSTNLATLVAGSTTMATPTVSYIQPYITYTAKPCPAATAGCSQFDLVIWQYDVTGLTGIPAPTVVADLTTACSLTSYSGAAFTADLNVSLDDQTFSAAVCTSGTCGQDQPGAVYAVSWNRANGCSYLKTDTWQVFNNGTLLGSATNPGAAFAKIHNAREGANGAYVRITPTAGLGLSQVYAWTPFTTTVNYSTSGDSCGHLCNGSLHVFNKCTGTHTNGIGEMAFTSLGTWQNLAANYPSPSIADSAHVSCANANTTDTNPFFVLFAMLVSTFPTYAWQNEVVAQATDGSGKSWRLFHSYATVTMQNLLPLAVSQSGNYVLWGTDWMGMLGCSNGVDVGCGVLQPNWVSGTAYTTASVITPTVGNAGNILGQYSFKPTGNCTAGTVEPPAWTQSIGVTNNDNGGAGGCTWKNVGQARQDVFLARLPVSAPVIPTAPVPSVLAGNATESGKAAGQ